RVEMLSLAISGHPAFKLCRWEIDRGGVSYTVDTLAGIRAERPDDQLVFLLGSDQLHLLPKWREPARIMELAEVVYVDRAGEAEPPWDELRKAIPTEQVEGLRARKVTMPSVWLSSTDLRHRVEAGRSIRYQTPAPVERYIIEHGLYRGESPHAAP
ncbi:MAG TPA: nicotinate-nicotinamide nucleotide adenylyltransferase, partial [Pirellulales bacterium]